MKIGLALVAAAALGGCSTVRFAYDNADSYVRWKIATYVDLQGEAAEEADERIDEFHAWHRKNELPKYARLAHEASRRFADGLSRQDVVWGYDSLREQARESLRKAGQLAAPLVDRLTPEQVAQIERRFAEDSRQYYRNHLRGSERERRAKRAKQMIERLEDWVGKLTQAQAERVRDYVERAPALDELRDRDRKRIQRELLAIIRARSAQQNLPEHLAHWERNREPGFVAALQTWRAQYSAFMVDLDRMLTPEQRARALGHLRRYAEDFEALSAR